MSEKLHRTPVLGRLETPDLSPIRSSVSRSPSPLGAGEEYFSDSFSSFNAADRRPLSTRLSSLGGFPTVSHVDPYGLDRPSPSKDIPGHDPKTETLLGRGAYGSASVVESNDGNVFVLKKMYPGRLAAKESGGQAVTSQEIQEYRQKMEAEAKILAHLDGIPGVPRFIGSNIAAPQTSEVETIDSPVMIAMEHVKAPSLRAGQLSEEDAKAVVGQLLKTLDTAHQRGVAHFDVKPENLLWDGKKATLIDWGNARFFDPNKPKMEEIPSGTERYRPGFQFDERGDEPIQLEAYALGKTASVLLNPKAKGSQLAKEFIEAATREEPLESSPEQVRNKLSILLEHPWLRAA